MTTAPEPLNYHAAISSALDSGMTDPSAIAAKVLAEMTPEDFRQFAHQQMRAHVVREIGLRRNWGSNDSTEKSGGGKGRSRGNPGGSGKSSKRDGIRSAWQKRLDQVEYVQGEYKHLRACTVDDLRWLAEDRRKRAQGNLVVADQYEALATVMVDNALATAGDVPDAIAPWKE